MYNRIKQSTLALGDFLMLIAGLFLAIIIRYGSLLSKNSESLITYMLPLFGLSILLLFIAGLYDIGKIKNNKSLYVRISVVALTWTLMAVLFFYTNPAKNITPKTILALTTLLGFGFITIWRTIYHTFISKTFLSSSIIFFGNTRETLEIITLLKKQPEHGYRVVGCVTDPHLTASLPLDIPHAASLRELLSTIPAPDSIIVSPNMANNATVLTDLYSMLFHQVSIVNLSDFYEHIFGRVPAFTFSEGWFITNLHEQHKKMYDRFRILVDYFVAGIMFVVFIITFPFIALALKLTSRGPILFKQTRIGRTGQPFTMYKYRTMQALTKNGSAEVAGPQYAVHNDQRVTVIGKLLRKTRFDELPQCINILKGNMALIGPRPERPEFVEKLTEQMPFYTLRHLVKPGLTGWAQLQQSYYGNIEENLLKLQYDLYYVKNRAPLLDTAIVLKTFNILVRMMGR